MIDLAKLREVAEEATPGPWTVNSKVRRTYNGAYQQDIWIKSPKKPNSMFPNSPGIVAHLQGTVTWEKFASLTDADAKFVEEFNPGTVLALLDRIKELENGP